jgi:hypothetical protein
MLSNGVPFVFVRELMGILLAGTLVGAGVPVLVSGPSLVKMPGSGASAACH